MSRMSGWGSTEHVYWGMDGFGRLIVYWGKRDAEGRFVLHAARRCTV